MFRHTVLVTACTRVVDWAVVQHVRVPWPGARLTDCGELSNSLSLVRGSSLLLLLPPRPRCAVFSSHSLTHKSHLSVRQLHQPPVAGGPFRRDAASVCSFSCCIRSISVRCAWCASLDYQLINWNADCWTAGSSAPHESALLVVGWVRISSDPASIRSQVQYCCQVAVTERRRKFGTPRYIKERSYLLLDDRFILMHGVIMTCDGFTWSSWTRETDVTVWMLWLWDSAMALRFFRTFVLYAWRNVHICWLTDDVMDSRISFSEGLSPDVACQPSVLQMTCATGVCILPFYLY